MSVVEIVLSHNLAYSTILIILLTLINLRSSPFYSFSFQTRITSAVTFSARILDIVLDKDPQGVDVPLSKERNY